MGDQLALFGDDGWGRQVNTGHRLVYFVQSGEFVKIGYTTRDMRTRLGELQTANPGAIKLLGTLVVDGEADERKLHARFARFHHDHEWFIATAELLGAVRALLASAPAVQWVDRVHDISPRADGKDNRGLWGLPVRCPACRREAFFMVEDAHLRSRVASGGLLVPATFHLKVTHDVQPQYFAPENVQLTGPCPNGSVISVRLRVTMAAGDA